MANRVCPFCKEKVNEQATICKHCRSELPPLPPPPPKQWYQTWKGFFIIMFVLGIFVQMIQEPSIKEQQSSQNSQGNSTANNEVYIAGKNVHKSMLIKYKHLDHINYSPYILGIGTENPKCCIAVPIKEWKSATNKNREILRKYAEYNVNIVKADPFKYAGDLNPVPSIADKFKANAARMGSNSWCIEAGSVTSDGKTIQIEKTVASGG